MKRIKAALRDIPLGGIRFYKKIGSTNDAALAWAGEGAADLSLVIADEQTAGRGRAANLWYTLAGCGLAFSLVLHPRPAKKIPTGLYSMLGSLAVSQALEEDFSLSPRIKWPNDVLLNHRKISGSLTEANWLGDRIEFLVLGVGVNVTAGAVPPGVVFDYSAGSIEECTGHKPARILLLRSILHSLVAWSSFDDVPAFLSAMEGRLAFLGEMVEISNAPGSFKLGLLDGLNEDGSLRLISISGDPFSVHMGEVHLRPHRL